ncbi:MAG: ethanolamine utilization protein EutH [Clostridia bacterium]|nr:ethanolamine utilization protein EutH [Clostridia bacterium]
MTVLRWIFAAFALLGAADKLLGGRLKLGEEFEKGILCAGTLALAMAGMLCMAPPLATLLSRLLSAPAEAMGMDLSVIGAFIANDMGGAAVAEKLAADPLLGSYNGLVVASMMGVTLCFTVPVALRMIDGKYHPEVLRGVLCGVATLPVGCILSGLMLKIPLGRLLWNLAPVLAVAAATCVGLVLAPKLCCRLFAGLGWVVSAIITVGLGAGVFTHLTGKTLIPGLGSLPEAMAVVCDIAIILAGVFPLIRTISVVLRRPLGAVGRLAGINDRSVLGLLSSLANSIPTFGMVAEMDGRGRVMNMAFAVSAAFVFGDHLAFTMAFDEKFAPAVIAGKLLSGLAALAVAALVTRKDKNQAE